MPVHIDAVKHTHHNVLLSLRPQCGVWKGSNDNDNITSTFACTHTPYCWVLTLVCLTAVSMISLQSLQLAYNTSPQLYSSAVRKFSICNICITFRHLHNSKQKQAHNGIGYIFIVETAHLWQVWSITIIRIIRVFRSIIYVCLICTLLTPTSVNRDLHYSMRKLGVPFAWQ